MAKFYEVLNASALGDPWGEGNKNQSYWCQLDGIDLPVMINAQSPINAGDQRYGDIIMDGVQPFQGKKSQYYKFKGSLIPEGTKRPQSSGKVAAPAAATPSDDARFADLEARVSNLEKLLATPTDTKVEEPEEHVEGVAGGSITPEDLADIFGGEVEVTDIPNKEEGNNAKESE